MLAQVQSSVETTLNTSLDIVVVIGALLALTIFGVYFGKDRLFALILSWYAAATVFLFFPYGEKLMEFSDNDMQLFGMKLAVFLVVMIIFYLLLARTIIVPQAMGRGMQFVESLGLSFLFVGLVFVLFYHVIPIGPVYNFSALLDTAFASQSYMFGWLLAPIAGLWITRR